jgi:hypothetical protein
MMVVEQGRQCARRARALSRHAALTTLLLYKWWMFGQQKRTNIKAVDNQDFPSFLKKIGAYEMVVEGKAKCLVCGDTLNIDDVEAVVPKDGEVCFVCRKPKCGIVFAGGDSI